MVKILYSTKKFRFEPLKFQTIYLCFTKPKFLSIRAHDKLWRCWSIIDTFIVFESLNWKQKYFSNFCVCFWSFQKGKLTWKRATLRIGNHDGRKISQTKYRNFTVSLIGNKNVDIITTKRVWGKVYPGWTLLALPWPLLHANLPYFIGALGYVLLEKTLKHLLDFRRLNSNGNHFSYESIVHQFDFGHMKEAFNLLFRSHFQRLFECQWRLSSTKTNVFNWIFSLLYSPINETR